MADLGKLTPEEMKAAGLGKLTPSEMQGRDLGPRTRRDRDTVAENARLGLTTGMADPRLEDADMDLSGDGLATAGPELSPLEKQVRDERQQAHPFEGDARFLREAAPFMAGGAMGAGAKMLLGRAAVGSSPVLARGADAAKAWAARSLEHGNATALPVSILSAMFPTAGTAAAAGARAGATGLAGAATGAGAIGATGAAGMIPPDRKETPEQMAIRLLLGPSPFANTPTH